MRDRCVAYLNPTLAAETLELLRGEVGAIVSDNAVRDSETAGDHREEIHGRGGSLICHGHCFDPLGEFVDCYEQMHVSSRRRCW